MGSALILKAKVCLIGDAAVGKTSLVRRYAENAFDDRYVSTLGSTVSLKRLRLAPASHPSRGLDVRLSVWDLIGERSYLESLHREYLKGAQGLIAVCDITRYSSFEALDEWIPAAFRVAGQVPLALVVNKVDQRGQIMCLYDLEEPEEKAKQYQGFSTNTSAKTGKGVRRVFEGLAREIVDRFAVPMLM